MSQKKVDRYKEEKANRSKIIKKEKRIAMLERVIGILVLAAAVCWIGFSVHTKVTERAEVQQEVKETVIDMTALDNYLTGIEDVGGAE